MESRASEDIPGSELQSTVDKDKECLIPLSPDRRSCFNLSNVEPCVNKAITHLDIFKKRLSKPVQTASVVMPESAASLQHKQHPQSRNATPKSILVTRRGDTSSSHSSRLMIEGVAAGIPVEKDSQPKKQVNESLHFILLQFLDSIIEFSFKFRQ